MIKDVLKLLLEGEAIQTEAMASVLGVSEAEIEEALAKLEEEKTLLGWRPVINPKAIAENEVRALIEVSIIPEREGGFNRIAERIARFDQVVTCYLMSGGYDLLVVVRGNNLLSVATFVSEKLATLDPVQSTATRFMLRCYKRDGFLIDAEPEQQEKLAVSP
ncbi:MAG: Lrp/AsnC family transcriptional regulator [Puniceicoccaceae bacterium]